VLLVTLVVLFVVLQIIGEIVEVFGKVSPEFLKVRKYFSRKKKEKEEEKQTLKECKELLSEFNSHYDEDNITKRNKWMNGVNKSVQDIQKLDNKIDKILEANENLKNKLDKVEANVLENEADRLRSELFDCGNRCRRNIRLHPEEMDHIREVYHKYSVVLKQNGPGEKEFNFITDYYNNQDFPAYHQRND
jgi:rRNA processing protein Gar1